METISIIIPTMAGREELLELLIKSIEGCVIHGGVRVQTVIVRDEDLLLAAKRNKGGCSADGEWFLFIDDDNHLQEDAILHAIDVAQQPGIGIVGFMACYDDKSYLVADGGSKRNYLTGFTHGINTNAYYPTLPKKAYEVDEIANAFLMHCELFFELHGFDEKKFPIDLDEADFCKRVKNKGLKIMIAPAARCFHRSQTYSHIPDFRRPLNAYFMGRNRVLYQRKHNSFVRYCLYVAFFCPVFVCFYSVSLLWRRKPKMILHFLKGVFDGLLGRRENKYQKR